MNKSIMCIVYVFLASLLSGCMPSNLEKLNKHKLIWEQQNLQNYSFVVNENCGKKVCPAIVYPHYKVTVYNNKVIRVVDSEGRDAADQEWSKTFDNIFEAVENRLSSQGDRPMLFNADKGFITHALNFEISDVQFTSSLPQVRELNAEKEKWHAFLDQSDITRYSFHFVGEDFSDSLAICSDYSITGERDLLGEWKSTYRKYECKDNTGSAVNPAYASVKSIDELFDRVSNVISTQNDPKLTFDKNKGFITQASGLFIRDVSFSGSLKEARKLNAAKKKWEVIAATNYRMTYQYHCRCNLPPSFTPTTGGKWVVDVKDGKVVSSMINGVDVKNSSRAVGMMSDFYAVAEVMISYTTDYSIHNYSLEFDDQGFLSGIPDYNDNGESYSDIKFEILDAN